VKEDNTIFISKLMTREEVQAYADYEELQMSPFINNNVYNYPSNTNIFTITA
jgi:hypothetical protein